MSQQKGRILSGMRPTGRLHLGNYLGALDNWVKLQDEYECLFCIADWHALTSGYKDTSQIKDHVVQMAADWLSAGIDPDRCVIFKQSDVKEHAELHLLLSMITPLSWLERCPTYKEQLQQLSDKDITTYGFLGYPVLQAADILVYQADTVPVGEDQLPHLELAREIARRFNHLYSSVFPEPQAKMTKVPLLPGLDGRKMSKSYGNVLLMAEDPQELAKKIRAMVTDPQRVRRHDPGDPQVCPVFAFHKLFNPQHIEGIDRECRRAGIGCVDCKKQLTEGLIDSLGHIFVKRQEIMNNPGYIHDVLAQGAQSARKIAQTTLDQVRNVMQL